MNTIWNNETVRTIEKLSIRQFMERYSYRLIGNVLDFGCGKQPYRQLLQPDANYVGFDIENGVFQTPIEPFDTIMCNQVIQYIEEPRALLRFLRGLTIHGGTLIMTYPTTWAEVEETDLFRFTRAGMESLLSRSGWQRIVHEQRAVIDLNGFKLPLGYGVIAENWSAQ